MASHFKGSIEESRLSIISWLIVVLLIQLILTIMKEVDVQAWVNALPDPKSAGKVTRDFKEVLKGRMEFYTTVLLHQSVDHLRGAGANKDVKEMKESLKDLRDKDEDRTELIRSILRKMTPSSQNEDKTPLIIS